MSPEEVQDILDAYASPVASLDSTVETTDSLTLADADASVDVETSASTTAESVTPIEGITAYDRGAIDQFLHENLQLAGNSQAFEALGNFFAALNALSRKPAIHVLHYGDSQIEGDRITGHLRNAWQSVWGGSGPGFLSPLSPIPTLAMRQSWNGEWKRYARFGKRDTTIQHNRFGLMAAFAQPRPAPDDSTSAAATLRFEPPPPRLPT